MSDKIDYSSELLGDREKTVLGTLNVHTDFTGKFSSLFQRTLVNDLAAVIPRLRSFLNLSFDEGSKFGKHEKSSKG